jgi:hypothetical protein
MSAKYSLTRLTLGKGFAECKMTFCRVYETLGKERESGSDSRYASAHFPILVPMSFMHMCSFKSRWFAYRPYTYEIRSSFILVIVWIGIDELLVGIVTYLIYTYLLESPLRHKINLFSFLTTRTTCL